MIEAVFFDRDGTLGANASIEYPQDFAPFPGIRETVARLHAAGIKVYLFTNQSCIARGKDGGYSFDREFAGYGVDDWFICPHDDADGCDCRKPKTGLLLQAREKCGVDLSRSVVVGDRVTDLQCGLSAGTGAVLVLTGRGRETLASGAFQKIRRSVLCVAADYREAADFMISRA